MADLAKLYEEYGKFTLQAESIQSQMLAVRQEILKLERTKVQPKEKADGGSK